MGWDVGESGGEDGVFGWGERWGRFVLVGMVGAATLPEEGVVNLRYAGCLKSVWFGLMVPVFLRRWATLGSWVTFVQLEMEPAKSAYKPFEP